MATVVITRNYQVTLSKDVREEADVEVGEKMKQRVESGKIILEKINKSPVEAAAGIWKNKVRNSIDYVNDLRKDWRR